MAKLWQGRTDGTVSEVADRFNASISIDSRLYQEDIRGSMAHAAMLGAQGIIAPADVEAILAGLEGILCDLQQGVLAIDPSAEDIHTFVEQTLVSRIGDAGKRLHTARSRNDQVALDMRLYVAGEIDSLVSYLVSLCRILMDKAEQYRATVMCGYTHLQRAQPITFGHHLMAYVSMFLRDIHRFADCKTRMMAACPIGSCALAGTTHPIDRQQEALALGFDAPCANSMDGVSDRDYCVEVLSATALTMVHLSRFCEEIILWTSWEFGYIELEDAYTTGSSIMPQKKNPDIAELTRGKSARVVGDLTAMLTLLKGLPLAYNKDMQEDKSIVFDALDTLKQCLEVFAPMVQGMRAKPDVMLLAAQKGFINATDVADYLAQKGVPFRTAYKITGEMVAYCIRSGKVLEQLSLDEMQGFCAQFEGDVYPKIALQTCVKKRTSLGGTAPESVDAQIKMAQQFLAQYA